MLDQFIVFCVRCLLWLQHPSMVLQALKKVAASVHGSSSGGAVTSTVPQSLSEEDMFSRYVTSMPKPIPTGDPQADQLSLLRRSAFQRVVHHLETHEDEILTAWSILQAGMAKPTSSVPKRDSWDRTVCSIARLPKYWKAQWLVAQDKSTKPMTQRLLDLADANDLQAVHHIFNAVTLTMPGTVLPPEARDCKAVCDLMFQKRLQSVGSPLTDWASRYISDTGKVDWGTAVYQLSFGDTGGCDFISFLGKDKVACTVSVTKDFEIVDPWCPWKACAIKRPAKHFLHEFFEKSTGPNQFKLDKKATVLCQIATAIKVNRSVVVKDLAGVFDDNQDYIGEEKKKLRQEALKKIQEKAVDSAKKRRTVALT
jgi:hypothetical protein